jgi:hypothetical protein
MVHFARREPARLAGWDLPHSCSLVGCWSSAVKIGRAKRSSLRKRRCLKLCYWVRGLRGTPDALLAAATRLVRLRDQSHPALTVGASRGGYRF